MANPSAKPVFWLGWSSERDRWPLWLPVLLGSGAALYFALHFEPGPFAGWGALVFSGLLAAAALAWRAGWVVLALLAALALGFAVTRLRADDVAAPVLAREGIIHLNARIAGMEAADAGVRLILEQPISGAFCSAPARLAVTQRGDGDGLQPGGWISLTADLSPPRRPSRARRISPARCATKAMRSGSRRN